MKTQSKIAISLALLALLLSVAPTRMVRAEPERLDPGVEGDNLLRDGIADSFKEMFQRSFDNAFGTGGGFLGGATAELCEYFC